MRLKVSQIIVRVYIFVVVCFETLCGNKSVHTCHSFLLVPTPPRLFTISHPSNSSLRLQWATPAMMDGAPNIHYHITYQPMAGSVLVTNSTSNNAELSMLSSGTSYNVTVQTVGPQNQMSSAVHNSSFTCEYNGQKQKHKELSPCVE